MLNGLDLFSGIGGLSLALEPWVRPIAYCENDRHAQAVLLSRMREGTLERAPIWDDVVTLSKDALGDVEIDIIYGGFPCQDISAAGRGVGMEAGSRSGLFFEIMRLTKEIRPAFVFLENVPAIRTRGLARVLHEFTALRYDCRWTVVSAAELGAPHLRRRWFLLAADSDREPEDIRQAKKWKSNIQSSRYGNAQPLADTDSIGRGQGWAGPAIREWRHGTECRGSSLGDSTGAGLQDGSNEPMGKREALSQLERPDWWAVEPNVGRVAHGIPFRVDRLRGLGNAVVPAQAREAFQRLSGLSALTQS